MKNITMYDFDSAKKEYREFCENEDNDIQIFAQPWYLDAVCETPDDWKVILYKENEKIVAAFPFEYKKGKYGFWHISNPPFAPRLGIWIKYTDKEREGVREDFENKIIKHVVDNLPKYDEFKIIFDSRFQNWQQFYREGFTQTTRYSYLMPCNIDAYNILPTNARNQIKKLLKQYNVDCNMSGEEYWQFVSDTYKIRNKKSSYCEKDFMKLHSAVEKNNANMIFRCKDARQHTAAAIYVLLDNRRMYNMFETFDPNYSSMGIQKLTKFFGINVAAEKKLDFDFEGSMIPGVAEFNRRFNAKKEQYFLITKYSNRYLLLDYLRKIMHTLKNILLKNK